MNFEKLEEYFALGQLIIFIVLEIISIIFWIIVITKIVKYFKNKKSNQPKHTVVYRFYSETDAETQNHGTKCNSDGMRNIESYNYNDDDDEEERELPRVSENNKTCTSGIGGYACSPVSGGWNYNNGISATEDSYGNLYFDNGETAVKTPEGSYYFSDGKTGYEDSYGNIQLNDGQVIIKR